MKKKTLVWGAAFGLVAPLVGIFVGLQVSVWLGNILAFPLVGLSYLTGQPFGMWSVWMLLLSLGLSMAAWALIFGVVARLGSRRGRKRV